VLVQAATQGDPDKQRDSALEPPWLQAFGATRAAHGLPALGGVLRELCAIVDGPWSGIEESACTPVARRRSIAGQGWLDTSFTRERLRESFGAGRSRRLDLLHIGTHFVLQPGAIHRSWMLLGNGTRLPVQDLVRWPLRSQDVVTLSACQTALGGGAEVEGLAGLLLRGGAGHVVASLWQVGDDSTAELMQDFYAYLASGKPPAEALQMAQRDRMVSPRPGALDRAPHPADWAGFVLSVSDTARP
jgi:CHAT domain-containing protein